MKRERCEIWMTALTDSIEAFVERNGRSMDAACAFGAIQRLRDETVEKLDLETEETERGRLHERLRAMNEIVHKFRKLAGINDPK